jgi:hypothetical protein
MGQSKFANIVAMLSLMVAVYTGWQTLRDKNPELTVRYFESGLSKGLPTNKDFGVRWVYRGAEVTSAKVIQIELINSGHTTIIGEGVTSNIVGEGIVFQLEGAKRVLAAAQVSGPELKATEVKGDQTVLVKIGQLRPGESLRLEVISESDKDDIVLKNVGRVLINGDVLVERDKEQIRTLRPQWLPTNIWNFLRLFSIPFLIIWAILCMVVLFVGAIEYLKLRNWISVHATKMKSFLEDSQRSLEGRTEEEIRKLRADANYVQTPWLFFRESVDAFVASGGKPPPVKSKPTFSSLKDVFFLGAVFAMSGASFAYAAVLIARA